MRRGPVRFLLVASTALFALAWPAFGADTTVALRSRMFDDRVVSIKAGDTVTWIHRDGGRNHTVTASTDSRAQGIAFDSHPNCSGGIFARCMERNDTFRFVFDSSGTFTYFCKLHGRDAPYPDCGMCGQVGVSERSAPTPSTPPTATSRPTSPSPSAGPTASATGSPSGSPSEGPVAGPPDGEGGSTSPVAIATAAVALLAGSGFVVYRTLIKRSR